MHCCGVPSRIWMALQSVGSGSENWFKFGNLGSDHEFLLRLLFSASCFSILALFLWMLNSTIAAPLFSFILFSYPSPYRTHPTPWLKPPLAASLTLQFWWWFRPSGFLCLSSTTWLLLFGGFHHSDWILREQTQIHDCFCCQSWPASVSLSELLSDTGALLTNIFLMALVKGVFSRPSPGV